MEKIERHSNDAVVYHENGNHARSSFAPPFSTEFFFLLHLNAINGPKIIMCFFLKFKSNPEKRHFYFRNYDDINFYFFV